MEIEVEERIKREFPGLLVKGFLIRGVTVKREREELEEFKEVVIGEIKNDYDIETLKDAPIVRMYRDFFWRAGIDPTKVRPASEALIRRVLKGRPLPRINTLVDSYNLASMKTTMALAAFDANTLSGELTMGFARPGEEFLGIGMERPIALTGKEPVVTDEEKTIAVYPYRDSDDTKATLDTKNTLVLVCGVPGIPDAVMKKTKNVASKYITRFCGGVLEP
ncbi:MAG: B3/4 domain-containing protein [Candidatus Hydrothermarchaeales archaeon]